MFLIYFLNFYVRVLRYFFVLHIYEFSEEYSSLTSLYARNSEKINIYSELLAGDRPLSKKKSVHWVRVQIPAIYIHRYHRDFFRTGRGERPEVQQRNSECEALATKEHLLQRWNGKLTAGGGYLEETMASEIADARRGSLRPSLLSRSPAKPASIASRARLPRGGAFKVGSSSGGDHGRKQSAAKFAWLPCVHASLAFCVERKF